MYEEDEKWRVSVYVLVTTWKDWIFIFSCNEPMWQVPKLEITLLFNVILKILWWIPETEELKDLGIVASKEQGLGRGWGPLFLVAGLVAPFDVVSSSQLGATGSSISTAHSSLEAPRQHTLSGRMGSSSGSLTKELGVAAMPCRLNPRAVDSPCLLELCGPWWGTGLGSLALCDFTIQHHLLQGDHWRSEVPSQFFVTPPLLLASFLFPFPFPFLFLPSLSSLSRAFPVSYQIRKE